MANKKKLISCGKNAYWNGFTMVKCGEKSKYSDHMNYCVDCKLKHAGIEVGKVFYDINYCYGRWVHKYEILKINEKSVRVKCIFLDGRQSPQEYSNSKEKTLERFSKRSKTFRGAVSSAIKANEKAIQNCKRTLLQIPKQIKTSEKEITELRNLKMSDVVVSGDEQ